MGNSMSPGMTCTGPYVEPAPLYSFSNRYYGPSSSDLWEVSCQAAISGPAAYQVGSQPSWYECTKSCESSGLCIAISYEPSTAVCTHYAEYVASNKVYSETSQIMFRTTGQGNTCVSGTFKGFQIECGIDYTGGDIDAVHNVDFRQCINICQNTDGCIDVAYNGRSCYLKGSLGQRVSNPAVWTARKADAVQGLSCANKQSDGLTYKGFEILCGVDYAGNDIGSASTKTFEKCIEKCSETTGCVDVSYNGNMCYMKGKLGQLSQNGAVWTAKKSGVQEPSTSNGPTCVNKASDATIYTTDKGTQYQIHCDFEYRSGDLKSQKADSFGECIAACESTTGCIDVSYVGNMCYMKNNLTRQVRASGVSTAVLLSAVGPAPPDSLTCNEDNRDNNRQYTGPSQQIFVIECGADYRGGDLSSGFAATFQGCVDRCDSTQGCVALAYRGSNCYLKSDRKSTVSDGGVWGARLLSSPQLNTPTTTTTTSVATTLTTVTTPATSPTETV